MKDSSTDILLANSPQTAEQVSFGLNLSLRLRNPLRMPQLLYQIGKRLPEVNEALRELHFVHFARFLPTRGGSSLQVITEFDGPFDHYVLDFAISMSEGAFGRDHEAKTPDSSRRGSVRARLHSCSTCWRATIGTSRTSMVASQRRLRSMSLWSG